MKIRRELVPEDTIEHFAEVHDLVMEITERKMDAWQRRHNLARFIATFDHAEVSEGGMLIGTYGEGASEAEAIADYARRISNERIVIYADDPARRQTISVPRLVAAPDQEPSR